jgi:hypothetical protein
MPEVYLRRFATSLLRWGISIAPQETAEWGHAMLSEIDQVEGTWSALLWSLGGTGVLAKHALLSLIFPSRQRPDSSSGGELFAKESLMRKMTLAIVGSCVLASLLLLLAPIFRQALHVSLEQWHYVIHVMPDDRFRPSPELEALARQAEQKHDAEGIAFVAARLWNNESESARLAAAAVHLDPKLTWVYAIVAVRHPSAKIDRWVPELRKYDPQNALPYLIAAEKIDIEQVEARKTPHRVDDEPPAWRNAMAAAFQSPALDNYFGRLKELERRVLLRYGFDDPYQALGNEYWWWFGLPSYGESDSSRYAQSVLESAEKREAQGDQRGAVEKYYAVARFGQMIGTARQFAMREVVRDAYKQLEKLSEKEGKHEEQQLYAYLTNQINREQQEEETSFENRYRGGDVSRWNAFLARASGLTLLFSAGLLLTCAFAVIIRGRSLRLESLHPRRLTLTLGTCGSVGLLLSSAILYATYRPYAEILQRYIHTGDESQMRELSDFLGWAQVFPLSAVNFWFAVTALCVIALLLVVIPFLVKHLQARAWI